MNGIRCSTLFFLINGLLAAILLVLLGHAAWQLRTSESVMKKNAGFVARLGITDLCLFTEASYTRHPATADLSTPFQNTTASPDCFPSGSLVEPPQHLRN